MDETTTTEVTTTAVETPVVEATVEASPVVETPVDSDAAALAAFDKGVAEVAPAAAGGDSAAKTAADVAAEAAAVKTESANASAATPVTPVVDPTKKVDEAAKVDAAGDPVKPEVVPDPETDAAVTELGLKGKAETRFREMASTIKTQAQELEPLRAEADRGREWERLVTETKATPEQFGQSLGYLSYINSGDPQKMGKAFDFLLGELQLLGKNIGREVPGLVDPVADHPDLAQAVTFGEMTRAAALELAQRRVAEKRTTETAAVTAEQTRKKAEFDQGMVAVEKLSNRLKAEDPAFMEKLKVLAPLLDQVRQTVTPSLWVATIEDIYKRIQVAAPVAAAPATPARPPVGAMPLRATGTSTPMQRSLKDASELDAFNMGLESLGR